MRVPARARGAAGAARRRLRQVAGAVATGVATLATRVAYRRGEISVIALLSASLLGGLGVERWRERAPITLDRLEAEPPRLAPVTGSPAPRSAQARRVPRAERPRHPESGPAGRTTPPPTPETPLDLNQATAADLTRLPGIGPRLAERILARREALGGRFRSPDDLVTVPGLGRQRARALTALVRIGATAADGEAPDDPAETPGVPP